MATADTSAAADTSRTGVSRAVVWAGIALGTCLTVLVMWNGVRLRVPDLPSVIGTAFGALIVWVLFMAAAAVLSELTVRHHRAAIRHGWRHTKRGGRAARRHAGAAYRGAASRSRPWRTRLLTGLQARWAARGSEPLLFRRKADLDGSGTATPEPDERPVTGLAHTRRPDGEPETEADKRFFDLRGSGYTGPIDQDGNIPDNDNGPTYSWGLAGARSHWPADTRSRAEHWAQYSSTEGKPYAVCEYPPEGGPGRVIATYRNGELVPDGEGGRDTPSEHITPSTEGNTMTDPSDTAAPAPRGGHRVLTIGGTVPGEWRSLVAVTADFEPEDDADLLAWMASEVNGMSAYAEALTEVYETGVDAVGLDPVSLAALHDTADAAAEAAQAMASARQKFASHYAEVREFAASGGLLPHDGRWITGDGE